MPQPWSEIETTPQYRALAPDQQQAAKSQYFDSVVAPRVPKESLPQAHAQFFGQSDPASAAQEWAKQNVPGTAEMHIAQGAMMGGADEVYAGLAAAKHGVGNIVDRVQGKTPKFSMGQAYDAALDQARLNSSDPTLQQQFPGSHPLGLEMFGGALTGGKPSLSLIQGGKTVAGRIARSAMTGAGVGGATGFNSAEGGFENRAEGGAKGAGVGAMIGAPMGAAAELTGPTLRAAGYLVNSAKAIFQKLSGTAFEEATPEQKAKYGEMAVNYVKQMIAEKGGKVEDLTSDTAFQMGKPVTGAEAIGRQGVDQAASIARRSGETGDNLESQMRLRSQGTNDRLQEDLAKAANLDVAHTQGHIEQLGEDLRTKNTPRYEEAWKQKPVDVEHDKEFQAIASQPNFQAALATAKEAAANKQQAIPLFQGDDGKWYGTPSWQSLDMIKKAMQGNITRKHTNGVGQFIGDFQSNADVEGARTYADWMKAANPKYADAVAHAGDEIGLRQAYQNAPKLMSNKTSEYQFDKAINDMSPAELEAHKSGWVDDVYKRLQNGTLKPKDLQQPDFLAKTTRMLGESQARTFVGQVGQEMRLKANADRMMPNKGSITGNLKEASSEMDQKADELVQGFAKVANRRGLHVAAVDTAVNVLHNIFTDVRTADQRMLRDEVGKLLLMKPDQLRAKLESTSGQPLSPSGKEIGQMILHMTTGPVSSVSTQRAQQ